jgi:hypothetical protein
MALMPQVTPAQRHRRRLGLGAGQQAPTVATAPVPQPAIAPAVPPAAPPPTISQRISGIIDAGGPLMQQARTEGARQAQRRGLGSSSIAIGAAQNELYKAAAPIATNEAQIASSEAVARAQNRTQLQLQSRGALNERVMQRNDIASREALQRNDIRATRQEHQRDLGVQREIATWNLDANEQDRVATLLTGYQGTYEGSLAEIMNNKNMRPEARQDAINGLNARREGFVSRLQNIYSIPADISWDAPTPAPATTATKNKKKKSGGGGLGSFGGAIDPKNPFKNGLLGFLR